MSTPPPPFPLGLQRLTLAGGLRSTPSTTFQALGEASAAGKLARTAEERAGKDSVETAEELRDTRKQLQSVEVM